MKKKGWRLHQSLPKQAHQVLVHMMRPIEITSFRERILNCRKRRTKTEIRTSSLKYCTAKLERTNSESFSYMGAFLPWVLAFSSLEVCLVLFILMLTKTSTQIAHLVIYQILVTAIHQLICHCSFTPLNHFIP